MELEDKIQVSDIGVDLEYQLFNNDGTPFNLTTVTLLQLIFNRPAGAKLIVIPSFITDGSDGLIRYTTVAGDLNIQGNWKVQVYLEIGTRKFHSEVDNFYVHPNI